MSRADHEHALEGLRALFDDGGLDGHGGLHNQSSNAAETVSNTVKCNQPANDHPSARPVIQPSSHPSTTSHPFFSLSTDRTTSRQAIRMPGTKRNSIERNTHNVEKPEFVGGGGGGEIRVLGVAAVGTLT